MAAKAKRLTVSASDRAELGRRVRSQTGHARDAKRARIVLLAADGRPGLEIAELVGVSEPTVIKWRRAYAERGLAGLGDAPRSGRPRQIDDATRFAIWFASQHAPPQRLGITHWSSRAMAAEFDLDHATIARLWQQWGLQPWRLTTFKRSTDPEFEAKLRDVVGLYLNPPDKAIVLSIDEKSQIQALDRTQPMLPVRPGLPASRTHDYVRHGTTTLFAALEVATGKVTDACYARHRNVEFLKFLRQVAKAYPRKRLHIVVDNYATHKHPNVAKWLARNKRITLHFTPTSGSWLNLVETFFAIITRQAIHRGSFASVDDLIAAIRAFIDAYNDRCEPFTWTKTADEILAKLKPQTISATAH
jgi:transposase